MHRGPPDSGGGRDLGQRSSWVRGEEAHRGAQNNYPGRLGGAFANGDQWSCHVSIGTDLFHRDKPVTRVIVMTGEGGPSLIVVGSINIDLVATGERMPAPGETVLMSGYAEHFGGKGGNQAVAAAALGAEVVMVGAVGDDARGAAALADLAERSVGHDAVGVVGSPTGVAMILIDADGENAIAVVPGANADLTPQDVRSRLDRITGDGHVVLASLEIPLPAVEAAAAVRKTARLAIHPEPGPRAATAWVPALGDVDSDAQRNGGGPPRRPGGSDQRRGRCGRRHPGWGGR